MASPLSFGAHTVAALRPQAQKVHAIYNMSLGWEVWAQIELALEMSRTVRSGGRAELEFGRFERERPVYENDPHGRADFILEASLAHVRHLHFGELKCLIGRESPADFARRVNQDIAKVKAARPSARWVGTGNAAARAVTGHVIAITVDPGLRDQQQLDAVMRGLEQTQRIRWTVAAVSADNTIKVWTWSRPIIAQGRLV